MNSSIKVLVERCSAILWCRTLRIVLTQIFSRDAIPIVGLKTEKDRVIPRVSFNDLNVLNQEVLYRVGETNICKRVVLLVPTNLTSE